MAHTLTSAQARLIPAQPVAVTPEFTPAVDHDIVVNLSPTRWAIYKGTRAQLEAEGVIPDSAKWPERTARATWEANGLAFCLFRTRPEGMKGPMRLWIEADYWQLNINVPARDWQRHARRNIEEKAAAIKAEICQYSIEGQRQCSPEFERYRAARLDKAFQAFKSTFLPERKKPGRKPQAADAPTAASGRRGRT